MTDASVKEKFQTAVVDTVDLAYQACEDYVCKREGVDALKDIPFGGGYGMVEKEFDEALRSIVMMDYGLVMISHDEDKSFTDENGTEYQKIVPTLAKRPRKVVLRMTDINAYSKTVETEQGYKQVLYMRGTPRFEAGSRWRYMPAVIDFTYDNLIKAINDAISRQVEDGAMVVDEHINIHKERMSVVNYDQIMHEARELCTALVQQNEENKGKIATIVNKHFGMGKKLFEATREQVDIILLVVDEIRGLSSNR